MINKIKNKPNIINEIIEELKQSDLPLIIYGAGVGGQAVENHLKENQIVIDSMAVDAKYLGTGQNSLISIESAINKHEKSNILVAFYGFNDEHRAKLMSSGRVNKIYEFDAACIQYFCFDYKEVIDNINEYIKIYNWLEDKKSKDIFVDFMNARISCASNLMKKHVSHPQYFPSDILTLTDEEVIVDCGAYDGDTIREINKLTNGKYEQIIALEPEPTNFNKLSQNCMSEKIELHNIGAWNEKTTLSFEVDSGTASGIVDSSEDSISVDMIDNIVNGRQVTFIKMDIEGAEKEALMGARKTIKKNKPKLAICVYHKKEDLIEIPKMIKNMYEGYKFYLRAHHESSTEIVLYAI